MAMVGAYLFWQLRIPAGYPFPVAFVAAVFGTALIGIATYQLVMRPLSRASNLSRVVATLGLLILLQGVSRLIWGEFPKTIGSEFPTKLIDVAGVTVGIDRLLMLAIAIALTAGLWALSRHTALGLAVRANAENPTAVATLGWSPDALGTVTWGLGAGLAAIAGILLAPLIGIASDSMPLLVIPVLAAALVGRLTSFWMTLVGAMAIGIAQSEASQYLPGIQGVTVAVPFVIILVLLLIRGQGIPSRTTAAEKRPSLGNGRVDWRILVPTIGVSILLLLFVLPEELVIALGVTLSWGLVLLSVVVLVGYTGQLSLAQFTLGGIAALITGRLVVDRSIPFPAAFVLAIIATAAVGMMFAVPAIRARGINLAVLTLGLAVAVDALVFNNATLTGGIDGTPVGPQTVFGLNLDTLLYPRRWAVVILLLFLLCGLAAANVRRGASGRRLIAVRTNERAASALGINVVQVKLYAFGLAAAIAGVGGVLFGFRNPTILYSEFDPLNSILAVGYAFIGGVGYVLGSVAGGGLANGAVGGWILSSVFPGISPSWLTTIGGALVIGLALLHPDGIVSAQAHQIQSLLERIRRGRPTPAEAIGPGGKERVPAATLEVDNLVVRFGGVVAVDGATLRVAPGEIVALIGPNGAGKTTLIDAVTGYVPLAGGSVRLAGIAIDDRPVHRRIRAGLSRQFQSLELFESSTVRENLSVASDSGNKLAYLTDLIAPRRSPLSRAAVAALRELDLESVLDSPVSELSYGRRRLVAIARAIATTPSVLLLDEPAAGLSSRETKELARVVRRLADEWGMGILLIEHDMAFVMEICDQVVVLDFGRQIAQGPPAQIRRDSRVIAAYLGEDSAGAADARMSRLPDVGPERSVPTRRRAEPSAR
jgi:sulfate-transporting ATPase